MENIRLLIKILNKHGWYLKRKGGNHNIYKHPQLSKSVPVPRHKLNKNTAESILKQCGIDTKEMYGK